ncbi:hypothetical protein AGMMS49938_16790 [Fibrobacterales bacterium]|nr:hypothetical protein AGMMS49938_16790 [Fibrobacterales bacterium]
MRFLLIILLALLASSCSSYEKREAVRADHDIDMNIPTIDDIIVARKKEYISKCYEPVLYREASNNPKKCQTELQQLLERRWTSDFTQVQADMAADELFFTDVRDYLDKQFKKDRRLGNAVSKRFSSMDEIMEYYKPKYSFRANSK